MDALRLEMAEEVLATYGEEALYTPRNGGDSSTITVRFDRNVETYSKDGDLVFSKYAVGVRPADVPAISVRDTIEIGGTTYEVGQEVDERAGLKFYQLV
jgi:hypothetical protein